MNYYEQLEVDRNATDKEIKANYLRLCKLHHPDKGGSEIVFKALLSAYETLSDSSSRIAYNSYLDFLEPSIESLDVMDIKPVVEIDCTLTQLLSEDVAYTYKGVDYHFPGLYTRMIDINNNKHIEFNVTDFNHDGFYFIPNQDGYTMTYDPNRSYFLPRHIHGGNPMGTYLLVQTVNDGEKPVIIKTYDDHNKLIYLIEGGVTFENPITGEISESMLAVNGYLL